MWRTSLVVLLVLLTFAAVRAGVRMHRINATFQRTNQESSRNELLIHLGKPWKESGCGEVFGGSPSVQCARELIYKSPLAPIDLEYWAFRFDRNGRFLEKYHYVSP